MKLLPLFALHSCLAWLAGCATTPGYDDSLRPWAGASDIELTRIWGRPSESYQARGHTFLVYDARRTLHLPGTNLLDSRAGFGGTSPIDIEMFCKTTFELDAQKVVSWSFEGNDCNARRTPFRS